MLKGKPPRFSAGECSVCGEEVNRNGRYCHKCHAAYQRGWRKRMAREWLRLESSRFTTPAAFLREVLALLDATDYRLQLVVKVEEVERLAAELESQRTMGRVKVRQVEAES